MDISTLFQTVGGSLDNATQQLLVATVSRLIDTITPWALAGVTLYLTLYGYLILMGMIQQPAKEGMLKAGKIIFITALALNADTYLAWVVDTLNGLSASLAAAVTGKEGASVYQTLDGALNSGLALFSQCITKALDAGWTEMGAFFTWLGVAALFIAAFGLVVVAGGAIIVIASGLLKLVFAVGPLFLLALAFPVTGHLFEKWFAKAMTYMFQIVMMAFVMTVAVEVFEYAISGFNLHAAESPNAMQFSMGMVFIGVVLYVYARETARLAGELGGGLAVEMMTAAALAPARTVPRLVNPTSTRLDPTTGHRTPARRLEHLAAGRTVAAPAYRQAVLEQMRQGWKKPSGDIINRDQ